jgi:hypothetical protein
VDNTSAAKLVTKLSIAIENIPLKAPIPDGVQSQSSINEVSKQETIPDGGQFSQSCQQPHKLYIVK